MAAICARQFGALTTRQARAAGLTWSAQRWRVGSGRLFEVLPGVLALTPTVTEDGWHAAAVLWSGGRLSGETVLYLSGVRAVRPADVHVTVQRGWPDAPEGVELHRTRRWAEGDLARIRGLPATTVARALLDVAPRTAPAVLRADVHEAQFRKLIDPLSLQAVLDAHPGHPGLRRLSAIEPARPTSASRLEDRLGAILAKVPGPAATPQFWLTGLSGRRYRADFAYEDERVFLEADGRDAHARMLAFEEDRARDNDLSATGWLALRYAAGQLRRPAAVRDEVLAVLELRGGSLRSRTT